MRAPASGASRGPLAFIILTVLLDTMGFGLIIPVLPQLVGELGNVSLDKAATIGGTLIMTYALAQFLFSPVIGGLSDAHGRRPVLLLSMAGFGISMLVAAFATSLWMLFVGRTLAGITGASYSTANAYIADITPHERRAQTFGLLGVAFGLGFIFGPAIGGLLGSLHPRWPFIAAACLAGINMLCGIFLLPESLPPERRRAFDWRRANPIGAIRQLGRLGGSLRHLAATFFIWMFAIQSLHGIWSYVAAYRYHWTPLGIGLSLTTVGVLAVLINGLLVGRAVRFLGEWRTALAGMAAGTLGYAIQIFASTPGLAYLALTVGAFGGLTVPALQAMMTSRAASDQQGELQGALATLSSITVMAGPLIFSRIFAHFSGADAGVHAPGAPFVLSAGLAGIALALLALAGNPRSPELRA
ncbi:TCR/Tet family MFS transporter [Sandaracinobacteroides hominis]|uniref:TCR/Tet family MFS transporter n=1 Tax=Sandaracinobacteroides hominis TaxID=2780086 RepID=UPI0018F7471C|nr:TCR/Tet family MFS transporter [Sandaracinobacteroides hominis]